MSKDSKRDFLPQELRLNKQQRCVALKLQRVKKHLLVLSTSSILFLIFAIIYSDENVSLIKYASFGLIVESLLSIWFTIRFEFRLQRGARSLSKAKNGTIQPPAFAEWLAVLIKMPAMRDAFVGDLEEEFHRDLDRFGLRRARRFYWARTLRSIIPLLWQAAKRLGLAALAIAGLKKWIGL